ncbi:hypothetical protein SEA_NERGAL_67 [Mycobacterium Phage Nergal]|nr:hypothetical protein SEA_NERGAL_67 [Mycobacterium Phage Nergal]
MNTKRRFAAPPAPPQPEVKVNGRVLAPGTEVSITGQRGRFRFLRSATTSEGRITCDFTSQRTGLWRSFYAEQIKTVHRAQHMR